MLTPERAANLAWAAWAISWWAAAVWRKPAVSRAGPGAELLHLSITLSGFVLIFATPAGIRWGLDQAALSDPGPLRLWRASLAVDWALAAATVAGFVFCWWARIHLGDLWSGCSSSCSNASSSASLMPSRLASAKGPRIRSASRKPLCQARYFSLLRRESMAERPI